jgi:hypothetical protein
MQTAKFNEIQFSDADVVNPDDAPYFVGCDNYKPWLFHDHGSVLGIAFADCEQDALDIVADAGKLDRFKLDPEDEHVQRDYMREDPGVQACWIDVVRDGRKVSLDWKGDVKFLGNHSYPFDIEPLGIVELPNPPFSFVALFNAAQ